MTHGSIEVGGVRIDALCDVETDYPGGLPEVFPDVPDGEWPAIRARHPGTVGEDGRWRFHDHCYVVRSEGRTILLDTGIGPPGTAIADELHPPGGALPGELRSAGLAPKDVDVVVISHMHMDHIGWNVTGEGPDLRPTFPRATYLVQEADWNAYLDEGDPDGRAVRGRQVRSLRDLGVLGLVQGERELTGEVLLFPTPGHTPGSQSLAVASGGERALLCGDVANHPVQVTHPHWRSVADADPSTAAATRDALFVRVESERMTMSTAHFREPFGGVVSSERRRLWFPF